MNTVITALEARNNFGRILKQLEGQSPSGFVIQKRGAPRAVLLSIQKYIKLAAPEPEILKVIGEKSVKRGTDKLTMRQIDAEIRAYRREKRLKHAAF